MTGATESATATDEPNCDAAGGHLPGEPSMWFFVLGDLVIFGLYFAGYMYYRAHDSRVFLAGQAELNLTVGTVNTVVLLTSSLFAALGVNAARAGLLRVAVRYFGVALALGAAFPVLKLFEYICAVSAGMTPGTDLFFMFYFVMTGLHLCHLVLGLVILGFVLRNLLSKADFRISMAESGATYWHMVDLVWLVLFALLYLVR